MKFITSTPRLLANGTNIVRRLQAAGFITYFAGGCVRDGLLGRAIKDIDIATSATPDQVAALFPAQNIGVGKSFGVMLVVIDGLSYDVATFRTDGGYQDGRHPESITFSCAEHDAQRRDFTINALFWDPIKEELIDFVHGQEDLKTLTLRAINDPIKRFQEDRLRMLRAIRFAYTCGLTIESATYAAICHEAKAISCVSVERIRTEFIRMLAESPTPSQALQALYDSGLLKVFFPELCALKGCLQDPKWHPEGDVWAHTASMLDLTPAPRSVELVWAILLHDIGKPKAFVVSTNPDGSPCYRTPMHAEYGEGIADDILRRFKVSNQLREAVTTTVRYHMQFVDIGKMRQSTLRHVLGRPSIHLELALHRLDCLSSHGKLDCYEKAQELLEAFENQPILPAPFITGKDLIALGLKPNKSFKQMLNDLYQDQLEGATRNMLLEKCKLLKQS